MIGSRLRELREINDITQEQLGVVLRLSKKTISAYENNKIDPSTDTLTRIAEYFGVTADSLLEKSMVASVSESSSGYSSKSAIITKLRSQIDEIENKKEYDLFNDPNIEEYLDMIDDLRKRPMQLAAFKEILKADDDESMKYILRLIKRTEEEEDNGGQ